jgi:hypothetical protein
MPITSDAQRARNQKWYELNKEKAIAKAAARYAEKREVCLASQAEYRSANSEHINAKIRAHRAGPGRDKKAAYDAQYKDRNRESCNAMTRAWANRNAEKVLANTQQRRAGRRLRVNQQDMELLCLVAQEANRLVKLREQATGMKWEVDHVVPLVGKRVSGLHNPFNLAVIPMAANRRKSNSFEVG